MANSVSFCREPKLLIELTDDQRDLSVFGEASKVEVFNENHLLKRMGLSTIRNEQDAIDLIKPSVWQGLMLDELDSSQPLTPDLVS